MQVPAKIKYYFGLPEKNEMSRFWKIWDYLFEYVTMYCIKTYVVQVLKEKGKKQEFNEKVKNEDMLVSKGVFLLIFFLNKYILYSLNIQWPQNVFGYLRHNKTCLNVFLLDSKISNKFIYFNLKT